MKYLFQYLIAPLMLFVAASSSMAQAGQPLYVSNDSATFSGWCVDNNEHNVAIKFVVPSSSSYDLTTIKAPFEFMRTNPPSNISMDIFRWTANSAPPADPGDLIARLPINETIPSPDSNADPIPERFDYSFSAPSPVRLEAGSSYWVQFNVTSPSSCEVSLLGGNASPTINTISRDAEYQNWSGLWTDRTANFYTLLELIGAVAPPQLQDDALTVSRTAPTTVDVLSNDAAGVELDTTFTLALSSPSAGTLSIVGNQIQFSPSSTFNSVVTFTYQACIAGGACSTALVTLTPQVIPPEPPQQATPVPTLTTWGVLLLASIIGGLAFRQKF